MNSVTITVPVSLTSEEQAAIQEAAEAQGVSVDSLFRRAVFQIIARSREGKLRKELRPEQFVRKLKDIADMIPAGIPEIPLEALSRENIYTREDEL